MSRIRTLQAVLDDLKTVDPSHRRQGLGALWLDAAVQYGRAMSAVRLSLTTNIANVTTQASCLALRSEIIFIKLP